MRRDETREEKAERLVRDGRVEQAARIGTLVTGVVEGDHGVYVTTVTDDNVFFCQCEYGRYHNGSDDRCSHALALARVVATRHAGGGGGSGGERCYRLEARCTW